MSLTNCQVIILILNKLDIPWRPSDYMIAHNTNQTTQIGWQNLIAVPTWFKGKFIINGDENKVDYDPWLDDKKNTLTSLNSIQEYIKSFWR